MKKPKTDVYIKPRAPDYPPKKHEEEIQNRFECPKCGKKTVTVSHLIRSDYRGRATIACGACKLHKVYEATAITDPVDVYSLLVDDFAAGRLSLRRN
jgi:transcription elongation factor Elf1